MTREYLDDQSFYRKYLRDHPEREDSPWTVGMAAAGIIGGGLLAYKKGLLRPIAEMAIKQLGAYRNSELGAVIKGVRNWTEREGVKGSWKYKSELLRMDIQASREAWRDRMDTLKNNPFITDREGEIVQLITQRDKAIHELDDSWGRMNLAKQQELLQQFGTKDRWREHIQRQMNEVIRQKNNVTLQEQETHVKQTGYRFARLHEVLPHLSDEQRHVVESARMDFENQYGKSFADSFMSKIYDRNLLIHNKTGEFADLRDFRAMIGDSLDTLADDFTAPFVKINPVRMLYMNRFSAVNKAPTFHVIKGNTRQPGITSNTDTLGEDHVFINGNVFKASDPTKFVKENVRLVEGKSGPVARYYRNLAGLTTSTYKKPNDFWGKMRYNVGNLFKLGFQDEPIGRDISWNYKTENGKSIEMPNLADPMTWGSYLAQKIHNKIKPYESARRFKLEDAFGKDADWIVFNNFRTVEEAGGYKNYIKQFGVPVREDGKWSTAGRNNLNDVTTATLFPYGFFERLNSTLNQAGLGLPNDSLGSALSTARDLLLYRIAPIWLGVEAWKYANTESDNLLGFQFEDKFAQFYAGASTDAAHIRDALGITDWAKHFAYLMPGGDQISDLPLVGHFMDLNDSEEETIDYWKNGEDPVRKGRFWEFGNTPFTGGKIEYFQPNWVRRVLSDYEFTDTMYGSRDEYFANNILPTPTHPFAPLKALFFDPYHWEEKHYYDRPYLLSGSLPVLEDFPVIGSVLSSTVGQIFKPAKPMHQEYWASIKPEEGMYAANYDGKLLGPSYDNVSDDYAYDPVQLEADQAAGNDTYSSTSAGSTYEIAYNTGGTGGAGSAEVTSGNGSKSTGGEENSGINMTTQTYAGTGDGSVAGSFVLVRKADPALAAYTTPSGQVTPAEIPTDQWTNVAQLNQAIKEKSLAKADRKAQMMDRVRDGLPMMYEPQQILSPHAAQNVMSNLYYNITEMGGAYGFFTESVLGEMKPAGTKMAESSEMTSFSRSFWDMNIGNLGGDPNEIFRRFLPRDTSIGKNYNPVPNRMPSWMPGADNFIDFQHGDPYTKVAKGEMRLPGEAYERLYNIDSKEIDKRMELRIGASGIGYDITHIRDAMLRRDEIEDDEVKEITEKGTKWHEHWEQKMLKDKVAVSHEQWVEVPGTGVGGFYDIKTDNAKMLEYAMEKADVFKYYRPDTGKGDKKYGEFYDDGIDMKALQKQNPEEFRKLIQEMISTGYGIGDLKTMSDKKFQKNEMFFENVQQVNYYLAATHSGTGFLIHANRDQMNETGKTPVKIYAFGYNPDLYNYSMSKVESARGHIRQGLKDGTYGRGDFYDMIDQYRILSDVAPYSKEYRQMKKDIRMWKGLNDDIKKEIQEIDEEGADRKEDVRMYPYRFKHAKIETKKVTVDGIIDNNTFMVKGMDNPIKLAGLRAPTGKDDPKAREAQKILDLKAGDTISIGIDPDALHQINDDTYKTISAVVYKHGINKNRQLLASGVAKEKTEDFSPAAVHARFSSSEIQLGSMWETFAHFDSPYHTKLLQVRSPIEQYERRELYGKNWQEWTDPVNDFVVPWYQQTISRSPILALATGTLLGSAFGNTKFGRVAGALIGLTATGAGVAYTKIYEAIKGEKWIPSRRKKEWEMTEYLDTLKYVKYRRLYEWASKEAQKREHVDIRQMIAKRNSSAGYLDAEKSYLQDLKRRLHSSSGRNLQEALKEAREWLKNNHHEDLLKANEGDIKKAINARLKELLNQRDLEEIGPWTARALTYYNTSEKTMYGYDPGEPMQNFLAALPKKDRNYLQPFMEADAEDRKKIIKEAPTYMRRVLQASYGMKVDPKEDLVSYFTHHGLPDKGWIGWDDRASLDDVKVKMIKKEKLDPSEFNIWPQDIQQAAYAKVSTPNIHGKNSHQEVERRLYDVLKGIGLEDISVHVSKREDDAKESHVNAQIAADRRQEIVRRMNEDAVNLV